MNSTPVATTTKKILIIGPAWVGDMVMAQCLFKLLKNNNPDCVIDVLAPGWSMPLLKRMPEVNQAILMPLTHGQLDLQKRYQIGKSLRPAQYDQAILLVNSFKSALIPFWAKIPVRTGWRGEMRYVLLNDLRRLDKARYPLMIERFMALGLPAQHVLPKPYPYPSLMINPATQAATLAKYHLTTTQKILALCPGAEFGPAKRWPEKHYAAIANAKLDEGWAVWILGSPKDLPTAEHILSLTANRAVSVAGKTSLEEAIDLLSAATCVVSNDSGLMHIAAAVNTPLVAIYGPTSPHFTPPLQEQAQVLSLTLPCQPCFAKTCPLKHHRCMLELTPRMVLQAIAAQGN